MTLTTGLLIVRNSHVIKLNVYLARVTTEVCTTESEQVPQASKVDKCKECMP